MIPRRWVSTVATVVVAARRSATSRPGTRRWVSTVATVVVAASLVADTESTASAPAQLGVADLLTIAHPGAPRWSRNGSRIAFTRELDGALDLWWTAPERERAVPITREVDREPPARIAGFAWTAAHALLFSRRGDLHLHDPETGRTTNLTNSASHDTGPVVAADGTRLAFVRDGQVWAGSWPAFEVAAVTAAEAEATAAAEAEGTFGSLVWSPDGRFLAASFTRGETVVEDTVALMGPKLEFLRTAVAESALAVIDTEAGAVFWVERGDASPSQAAFSAAGTLAWQELSGDARRRRIVVAAAPDWQPRVVVEESDERWWTLTYVDAGPRWHPTDDRFVFVSERDGWAHLYLLDTTAADAAPRALTAGEFEVEAPAWSPDGTRLVVSSNRGASSERGLHVLDLTAAGPLAGATDGGLDLEPISRVRGTSIAARWRPDGSLLAFLHADPERPLDVWVQPPEDAAAEQVSDAWPSDVDGSAPVLPRGVRFSSNDGGLVPGQLFLPPHHDDIEAPIPAIVWVHGGGIRQNRYGWHPLRAYALFYGFHQHLLRQGYAVVTVDYRGSIGYGRDFRQGHFQDLGGRDLDDVLGAIRYLRRLDGVDIGRIGVWGISYGGFLAVHALVQAPGAFDAGINIAGVVDWEDWAVDPGGAWIDGRMGDAAVHRERYRASSPIHAVDRLARPLLTLHGTADAAVPVLQTYKLTDALVRAGKPFEVITYPGEAHTFERTRTWRDAFARVEAFFDAHLR